MTNSTHENLKELQKNLYTTMLDELSYQMDSLAVNAETLKDAKEEPYVLFLPLYGKITELYSLVKSGKYDAFVITQKQADISKDIELLKLKTK